MATAILSAARNQPVREDVAMTGEITLSGLVLPVGGIREKALAARRSGIKTFILPALNEPDLAELPEEVRRDMTFVPVETLEQVIESHSKVSTVRRTSLVNGRSSARNDSAATLAQAIVFYISGHGFGHASRSIEVINAILARRPETRIGVRTSAPRWLFDLTVKGQGHVQHARDATPASCRSTR